VRIAKLLASRLRCRQRFLGPLGNGLSLSLGDQRHDPDREVVGLRHVGGRELNASLLQAKEEMRVTGEAIKLGDEEDSASVRIPTKPATHSDRNPATDSDLKPAGVPI
jgi:hypothetical protein